MMRLSTASILGLAAAATALPTDSMSLTTLASRQDDDPLQDKEKFCHGFKLDTIEHAQELWDQTGSGVILDMWVESWNNGQGGGRKWLVNLEDHVRARGSSASGAHGCASLDCSNCAPGNPNLECGDYFDRGGSWNKTAYWIFTAAHRMHSKFSMFERSLNRETLINHLKLGSMIDELGGSADDTNEVTKWLRTALALAMGGQILGSTSIAPGTQQAIGWASYAFGQILDAVDNQGGEPVDRSSIENSLGDHLRKTSDRMQWVLRTAMGESEREEDIAELPAPSWDTYRSGISKFFNTGFWLLDENSDGVKQLTQGVADSLQSKVAHNILVSAGWNLVASKAITTQESCDTVAGGRMIEHGDRHYCFYLAKAANTIMWDEIPGDVLEALGRYKIGDLEGYYRSILDCQLNGNDGEMDMEHALFGTIARCYYPMRAVYYEVIWTDCPEDSISCEPVRSTHEEIQ